MSKIPKFDYIGISAKKQDGQYSLVYGVPLPKEAATSFLKDFGAVIIYRDIHAYRRLTRNLPRANK